ncbi:MAG TPA: ABC transporter substrate-binding protein [Caulobacteraceae bacterium]|nr:ABC transporter substrate-binding protein [Caulobacteraceae bacterium]
MAPRTAGLIAVSLIGLSAALSVLGAARAGRPHEPVASGLALDAPLPDRVPSGVSLTIGDPVTELALKLSGLERELPFQVKWARITGGPAVTEAFHARALDVGSAADMPPIHATWVGMPVKIVALRLREDPVQHPLYELAVAPGASVAKPADLKGKRIAYSPGQVQGEVVLRTLAAAGLTAKEVRLVELPSTSADVYIGALAGGLVDVAPIGAGAAAKRYLDRYGAAGAKVLRHPPFRDDLTLLYVREETLRDPGKAAALRAYVRLWGRAQAWIDRHPDAWTQAWYVRNQGLSPGDAAYSAAAAGRSRTPRDWTEAITLEQAAIDLMAGPTGRRRFAAEDLFDRRFEALAAEGATDVARDVASR